MIIIKKAIEKDFMETVGKRLKHCPMEIRYAYQELEDIPEGFSVPPERVKPWGTSHAVLCARDAIGDAPFAVVNSDDYYGKTAYRTIYQALCDARDGEKYDYCMVGYHLGNTVTENGSVSRGVCQVDDQGYLVSVTERARIEKYEGGIHFTEDGTTWTDVPMDVIVSMNMWGFTPSFLTEVAQRFSVFLKENVPQNPAKAEFFLPSSVSELLTEGKATVRVLHSGDKWFGVTYAADKAQVVESIRNMTAQGLYPDGLWE